MIRFQWLSLILTSVLATGSVLVFKCLGVLEPWEFLVFDRFTQSQPYKSDRDDIVIVEITEKDLQDYGWPISDQVLADLLVKLQQAEPRVIGLDIHRNIAYPPGTDALNQELQAQNLVTIQLVGSQEDNSGVSAPLVVAPERVGFNDLVLDADGVVRRGLLFVKGGEAGDFYSFALRAALKFLEPDHPDFQASDQLQLNAATFVPLRPTSGGYQNMDHRGYQTLLRYYRSSTLLHVSVGQLLRGEIEPELISGKLVLIGTTAPSIKDLFYTPYSVSQTSQVQMPGVMIHGQIVRQILDAASGQRAIFRFVPQWGEISWFTFWSLIGVLGIWRSRHPLMLLGLSILGCTCIIVIGWVSFSYLVWIPVAEPLIAFAMSMAFTLAQRFFYTTSRDQLTGLLNRPAFLQHLQLHVRQSSSRDLSRQEILTDKTIDELEEDVPGISSAVLYLKLDRLRAISGSLGTRAGEHVLREVVRRLYKKVSRSALLGRVGEDGFILLLCNLERQTLLKVADELRVSLLSPFKVNKNNVLLSVSIGVAFIEPQHFYSADQIFRNAQTAMYRAKALGEARHEVFADGMFWDVVNRLQLESDLLTGIQSGEFQLYYQPIVCLKTGLIRGVEALVRWQHPEQGLISPGIFIPIAEETGLIVPLGLWIFQEACYQLQQWRLTIPSAQSLMMSINLSSRQFEQTDLIQQFSSILLGLGMEKEASSIKLEITESMVMRDVDEAIDMMLQLKALDFQLSMDDFGTGYSSLSYLHRFPIDTLKIDQSFVRRMESSGEDFAIVDTIVTLGHKLQMDVIAEGIETEQHLHPLHDLGCEYGQGYFFSKPLSAALTTDLLAQNPQWTCAPAVNKMPEQLTLNFVSF